MNLKSLNRSFTQRLRLFIVTLIAGLWIFSVARLGITAPVSVIDALGMATTETQFPLIAATGQGAFGSNFSGFEFTLTQPTTLT